MVQETRKASDVLLDLESKVDLLLGEIRAQNLNNKILSNKLNDLIGRLDKQQAGPPKIIVETVQSPPPPAIVPPGFAQIPAGDPDRNIPFLAESKLPQDNSPQGFRRNSRPETYAKNKPPAQPPELQMPVQLPPNMKPPSGRQANINPPPGRGENSEVVVSSQATHHNKQGAGAVMAPPVTEMPQTEQSAPLSHQGQIPVTQRCVDKNGKSIFLADVEILDMASMQTIFKTRTNGTGKWMASLGIGAYRVTIRKRESVSKEKIESVQDIQIDGSQSRLELPMLIIK